MPGWFELLIIFGVILLFFGASRLPEIARSMGESVGEFKDGLKQGGDSTPELDAESPSDADDSTEQPPSEETDAR